ncbi:MAG: HD-GYP domain-containing protein [Firmicutes bacterium]|jgi:HD-GYP domain-containing protein (c-di-GMP phosphodiesterase class II)|nr:HD-GYP domain-containing protein [Bacillota bacterium]
MKYVFVEDLEKGMVLGEDLLNEFNSIVFLKDHILDEKDIESIVKLNYLMVKVSEKKEVVPEKPKKKVIEKVKETVTFSEDRSQIVEEKRQKELQTLKDSYLNSLFKFKDIILKVKKDSDLTKLETDVLVNPLITSISAEKSFVDILKILNADEEYIVTHSINVGIISYVLGNALGYRGEDLKNIMIAGIFHDIGKIKIDQTIIQKDGKLTEEEYLEVKKHSYLSCEYIKKHGDFSDKVVIGILDHHERMDGSGYPRSLAGEKINIYSRIIAVADTYDAMTSKRVFADKMSPFFVLENLNGLSFETLDPKVCKKFIEMITSNYVGQEVVLSDGRKGKIVYLNKYDKLRPLVKIGDGFVDLFTNYDINIEDFA